MKARIPVEDRAGLAPEARAAVEALVQDHLGLDDVVRWGRALAQPQRIVAVVVQDEFTHDVIVGHPDGFYLVYDATCLGGVRALAIWPKKPSPRELLDARLESGWTPTATRMRAGPRILGYASCR